MFVVKVHNPYNDFTWYQGPFFTWLEAEQFRRYGDSVNAYERTLLTKEQYLAETDAPLLLVARLLAFRPCPSERRMRCNIDAPTQTVPKMARQSS